MTYAILSPDSSGTAESEVVSEDPCAGLSWV